MSVKGKREEHEKEEGGIFLRRHYSGIAIILLFSVLFSQFTFFQNGKIQLQAAERLEGECGNVRYNIVEEAAVIKQYVWDGSEYMSIPEYLYGYPVTSISTEAINGNGRHLLGDLVIPETIQNLEDRAFCNISFEGRLVCPSSLKSICEQFADVSFQEGELLLPEGIERIYGSFDNSTWIKGCLILPKELKYLYRSFNQCTGITDVFISEGVSILEESFGGIPGLTIHGYAGSEAERFAEINGFSFEKIEGTYPTPAPLPAATPERTKEPGNESWVCGDFEYELVEDGAKLIKYKGEGDNLSIPSEVDGHVVVELGSDMLDRNYKFQGDLVIPDGVKRIGRAVFKYKNFQGKLLLPASLIEVGDEAFEQSVFWEKELVIPDGVQRIGSDAFCYCNWIHGNLILPKGLCSIGSEAFLSCDRIGGIYIPDTVTEIGDEAFRGASTIYGVSGSEAERYAVINRYSFVAGTPAPTPAPSFVPEKEGVYEDFVYEWVDKGMKLIKYQGKSEYLSIPSDIYGCCVVEIGTGFLDGYERFKGDLVIPKEVQRIGERAFEGVSFEGKLELPKILGDIGQAAFYNSSFDEEQLIIPDWVQNIGKFAFGECKWIKEKVILPKGLHSLEEGVFLGCEGMKGADVFIPDTVESIHERSFGEESMDLTIYGVPGSAAEKFAKENSYAFVAGEIPDPTSVPSAPPLQSSPPAATLEPSTAPPLQQQSSPPAATLKSSTAPPLQQQSLPLAAALKLSLEPTPTIKADDKTTERENKVTKTKKTKKIKAPVFSLKKMRTASGKRYVSIRLKRYTGTYVEIWVGRKVKGSKKLVYYKLKIKKNNIRKAKGIFNFLYTKQKGTLIFRIRTYMRKGKKRIYSEKSKGKGIRLS